MKTFKHVLSQPFVNGQKVKLKEATPDMIKSGIRPGMIGVVVGFRPAHEGTGLWPMQPDESGDPVFLGVEFQGYSDTGWNSGLHVTSMNTRRDGITIPVIDLCDPLDQE